MEEKTYQCAECGKKGKLSELKVRADNLVSCPNCGYNWVLEKTEGPPKLKVVKKTKK